MRISVKAKPGVSHEGVQSTESNGEKKYIVSVHASPEKGKANKAIQKLLAKFFGVSQSAVTLIKGATTKEKIFEIKQ